MTNEVKSQTGHETAKRRGLYSEAVLGLLVLAMLLVLLWATFGPTSAFARASSGRGPFFFPRIVIGLVFLMLPWLFLGLRQGARAVPASAPLMRMGLLIGLMGLYCAALGFLGFLIPSILFAVAVPMLLGQHKPVRLAIIAVAYCVCLLLLFQEVFLIRLPASPWPVGF